MRQDIVFIHNTHPRVIDLIQVGRYIHKLAPGTNEVPADYWKQCKNNASIRIWREAGIIKEVGSPRVTPVQPLSPLQNEGNVPAPKFLTDLTEEQAAYHINACSDDVQLVAWGESLDPKLQQATLEAVVARLKALGKMPG